MKLSARHIEDQRIIERSILRSDKNDPSLFNGELGTALYCLARLATSSARSGKVLNRLTDSLDYAITELKNPKHNNPVNLGNGATGLIVVLNRAKVMLKDSSIAPILFDLETNIHDLAVKQFSASGLLNVDYFFGLSGVANYFVAFSDHADKSKMTRDMCDLICHQSEVKPGGIAWREDFGFSSAPYNLGMAHGIPGTVCVLSKASYLLGLKRYNSFIVKAMNWFLSQENIQSGCTRFSNSTTGEAPNDQKTWLSWCYGDLCAGIALLQAHKATGKQKFYREAMRIIETTLHRKNVALEIRNDQEQIFDVGLCHGLAAVCASYYVLARYTKDARIRKAFQFWFSQILTRAPKPYHHNAAGCYRVGMVGDRAEVHQSLTFLEGGGGLGLLYCSLTSRRADRIWLPLFHLDL